MAKNMALFLLVSVYVHFKKFLSAWTISFIVELYTFYHFSYHSFNCGFLSFQLSQLGS